LREDISKKKKLIDDNTWKITLNHNELKEIIITDLYKINQLETEQSEFKNHFEVKQGQNDQQTKKIV
jgi:hypothetical protein